ncbi:aminotransferase class I/II-fold pyridoxal phosphate-dependent enzyme [Gammaproteobacteria bacterium]|nr:aminotransferase class I/II-fold pyridoxal phosphate-dependent enzyme [Gammaproteobacteria bacterium]
MDYISQFEVLKSKELSLDLTRGKPSEEQLDLSNSLINFDEKDFSSHGIDIRNYGEVKGLEACRKLGSEILGCSEDYIWSGGNSSLSLMSKFLSFLFIQGNGSGPWNNKERVSVLCPVPGYDRHFKLCETFGINMIPVSLTGEGPDLEEVRTLVESDESIRGIWCVPKYSNPTGEVYSLEVIEGLLDIFSGSKNKGTIFWDNAYAVHDLSDQILLPDIFSLAKDKDCEDSVIQFGSTSKITFAGAGIGFIAMSKLNQELFLPFYSSLMIGPDKLNQAKHIRFFQDNSLREHMKKHAEILKPKFDLVDQKLQLQDFGTWTKPAGGYFVLYEVKPSNAKKVISLASELGLKLTPAGATHPYGIDADDSYIRIAPTACTLEELDMAMDVFLCSIGVAQEQSNL